MARTMEVQITFELDEYARLESIAAERGVSVAELVRFAVRERYLPARSERRRLVDEIQGMDLPVIEWEAAEDEVGESYDEPGLHTD